MAVIIGNPGEGGGGGPDLSDADPAPLGSADPGVSEEASRADHMHDRPTPGDIGAATAADIAALDYATPADVTDAVAPKANTADVDTALAGKLDVVSVEAGAMLGGSSGNGGEAVLGSSLQPSRQVGPLRVWSDSGSYHAGSVAFGTVPPLPTSWTHVDVWFDLRHQAVVGGDVLWSFWFGPGGIDNRTLFDPLTAAGPGHGSVSGPIRVLAVSNVPIDVHAGNTVSIIRIGSDGADTHVGNIGLARIEFREHTS